VAKMLFSRLVHVSMVNITTSTCQYHSARFKHVFGVILYCLLGQRTEKRWNSWDKDKCITSTLSNCRLENLPLVCLGKQSYVDWNIEKFIASWHPNIV
jgi:hypothetical protein